MWVKWLVTVVSLVVVGLHAFQAESSAAGECGTADPKTGEIVKGTLALNEKASTIERSFRRKNDTRTIQLVYDVARCDVASKPDVSPGPLKDAADEIPDEVLAKPAVTARGREVKVIYKVRHDDFDPGTYGSLIEVSDPTRLTTTRTPITLSRSEHRWLVPMAIGLAAGALGFFVFYWTKRFSRYRIIVPSKTFRVAAVLACGAGALAALFNWLDQDVWVWQVNGRVAAVTAFGQSTAGVMVALLAGVFSEKADPEPPPAENGDPEPAPPEPPDPKPPGD